MHTPSFFDAFCGCGGFSLGLEQVGLECVGALDSDARAVESFNANFGVGAECVDVGDFDATGVEADVVVGGLPCQGFSTIGKRDPNDARNALWRAFLDLVGSIGPELFVVENVAPFLDSTECNQMVRTAREIGYLVSSGVLDAVDFGVPQLRRRAFVVGSRRTIVPLPSGSTTTHRTVRQAIGDLPLEPDGVNDHDPRNHSDRTLERFRHVREGGSRFDLPKDLQNPCWIRTERGATSSFGRLWWDRPSVTIRTNFLHPECGRFIHPRADRGLTVREGARLQGFPDWFEFRGSMDERARQIGNAVPPPLARAVGRALSSRFP